MYKTIQGIYQDGVIIPTEPIEMNKNSQILITIYNEIDEASLQKLSTAELLALAEARAEKLKSLGMSRDVAVKQLGELIEEIRQNAISRGIVETSRALDEVVHEVTAERNEQKGWEVFRRLGQDAIGGKLSDASTKHDKYLYGKEK